MTRFHIFSNEYKKEYFLPLDQTYIQNRNPGSGMEGHLSRSNRISIVLRLTQVMKFRASATDVSPICRSSTSGGSANHKKYRGCAKGTCCETLNKHWLSTVSSINRVMNNNEFSNSNFKFKCQSREQDPGDLMDFKSRNRYITMYKIRYLRYRNHMEKNSSYFILYLFIDF